MTLHTEDMSLRPTAKHVQDSVHMFLTQQIDSLPHHPTELASAMKYALIGGGKRMRPLLCYLIADAIEVSTQDALVIGCAIECIHAYSLIHDDLPAMDDDDTRRGKPTCHIAFGEAQAILAGDALQALAFSILSDPDWLKNQLQAKLALVHTLALSSGQQGMCGGQAIDLAATGENASVPHTIETLTQLHRLKTGALLKACVSMPLLLNPDIPQEHIALFDTFAEKIGLAFQVQDDILDETGSETQTGKPQGSDAEQHKHTFPALLGVDGAKVELQNLVQDALHALASLPYNTSALVAFCDVLVHRNH